MDRESAVTENDRYQLRTPAFLITNFADIKAAYQLTFLPLIYLKPMPIKRRILCVDDQPDICDLVCTILADFEVVVAHSKTEGVRKVRSGLFDLYLLDYSLPDGTGLDLVTLIRQFDDSTSIIIATSSHTITDRDVSKVGAQGLVAKDDLPDDLLWQVPPLESHRRQLTHPGKILPLSLLLSSRTTVITIPISVSCWTRSLLFCCLNLSC